MLEIKYTKDGLKDVTYIVIDVQSKTHTNLETKGLFIALKPVADRPSVIIGPDDIFIWICADGNVHMFNTEYYNITGITLGFGQKSIKSQQVVYKEGEQREALERIKDIQLAMVELGRVKETGLMDLSSYAELPTIFENLLKEKDDGNNKRNQKKADRGIHYPLSQTPGSYHSSVYKPKVIETAYIKRTTKYSIKNALKAMESRIKDIANDKYNPPKLKKIPADNIKEEAAKTEVDDDDIYSGMGGYFC